VGIYVYAISRAGDDALPALQGILDQPVYRLAVGPLVAFVSDCTLEIVRAERKHIAASQRVLRVLNEHFDLLPVAFGTVAQSADALSRFLEEHRDELTAQLQRVTGAVEMSLRLNLDVPDAIAYLVERTPELKAARDRLFHRRKPPSHDERIRLGQLCDEALGRYRETQTTQLTALLGPSCVEIAPLPVRAEKEVASLAVLVRRDAIDRFESAVDVAAAQLADELAVTIGGPWPPHNFVRLNFRESLEEPCS
jgi:Gas vesicle synthesis protein GvpL/GvpF